MLVIHTPLNLNETQLWAKHTVRKAAQPLSPDPEGGWLWEGGKKMIIVDNTRCDLCPFAPHFIHFSVMPNIMDAGENAKSSHEKTKCKSDIRVCLLPVKS